MRRMNIQHEAAVCDKQSANQSEEYRDKSPKNLDNEATSHLKMKNEKKRTYVCGGSCTNDHGDNNAAENASCQSCGVLSKSACLENNTETLETRNQENALNDKDEAESVINWNDTFEDELLTRCPPQVVTKIFSYCTISELVHSISLVNKSWNESAYDSDLWREIDLREHVVSDEVVSKVTSFCRFIKCIKLPDKNNIVTDDGIVMLAVQCPNLTSFVAPRSGPKFTDVAFIALAEHCPKLRSLSLDCVDITDQTLFSIAWNLEYLEYLSLCQVSWITDEGVAEVIKRCCNLETLILNQNHQITEACLETIPKSSCNLRRLELMMCNVNVSGVPLIGLLHNLEHLNLSQCVDLTEHDLIPVLKGCPNLRLLSLNLNKLVDDRCIDLIVSSLPELNNIYLVSTKITDDAFVMLGTKGKKLIRVDAGYTKITAEGARKLSELCPTLQYLGLMRCDLISDKSVDEMVRLFPNVTYSTFMQDTKRLLLKANLPLPPCLQTN